MIIHGENVNEYIKPVVYKAKVKHRRLSRNLVTLLSKKCYHFNFHISSNSFWVNVEQLIDDGLSQTKKVLIKIVLFAGQVNKVWPLPVVSTSVITFLNCAATISPHS